MRKFFWYFWVAILSFIGIWVQLDFVFRSFRWTLGVIKGYRIEKINQKPFYLKKCDFSHFEKLFDQNDKYIVKPYEITTRDGYILSIFRVGLNPKSESFSKNKHKKIVRRQVIYLKHSFAGSADEFF